MKSFYILFFLVFYAHALENSFDAENYNAVVSAISERINFPNLVDDILNQEDSIDSISIQCLRDLGRIQNMNETWILNLIDSAGKIPHGILKLNTMSIGQYQQCIDTVIQKEPREVTGQHCMLKISVPDDSLADLMPKSAPFESLDRTREIMDTAAVRGFGDVNLGRNNGGMLPGEDSLGFTIGICIPSSCDPKAINSILKIISNLTDNIESDIIGNLPTNNISLDLKLDELSCTTRNKKALTAGDGATIFFFSTIAFIMLCSTLYDIWYQEIKKGDQKQQNPLAIAFSVYTNSRRLFTPSKNPGALSCLHGIRSLSLLWVVFAHRYGFNIVGPMENRLDLIMWFQETASSIILAGTVSVDSFFVMSGILLSYSFFRSTKLKNTLRDLPMFYIHRILRLTPLLAVVILIYVTLLSHYGNGPSKHQIDLTMVDTCKNNWWTTLLYVQNYVNEPSCVGQTWYLAVDMQLYVISPLLLYPLLIHKKIGIIWVSFCILVAQATAFTIAYIHKFPAGLFRSSTSTYQTDYYIVTHTRATPYFIGLLAGYFIVHSFQKNNIKTVQYNFLKLNIVMKIVVLLGWAVSLSMMGLVLFGYTDLNKFSYDPPNHWEDTMYVAFSRTAWSLGLLWIIVACAYGYGGPINWILSLPMWEIIGRFSYAVYLTHMGIQMAFLFTVNHMRLFTHLNSFIDFFGDIVLSFAISYLLVLGFESPITVIEKVIFKRDKKSPPDVPKAPTLMKDNIINMEPNNNNADPDATPLKQEEAGNSR